jgi:methylated-DNA-[protein]-cysteine S-methyltransferase
VTLRESWMESPLGRIHLVACEDALAGLYLEDHARKPPVTASDGSGWPVLREARAQLDAWFSGERTRFDLPLRPRGTPFQLEVWRALSEIPHGETRTYAEVARAIGRPSASRAVGAANARNPISIVVPCHRVVGADGALTGYAGGLDRKRWLLAHERQIARYGKASGTVVVAPFVTAAGTAGEKSAGVPAVVSAGSSATIV